MAKEKDDPCIMIDTIVHVSCNKALPGGSDHIVSDNDAVVRLAFFARVTSIYVYRQDRFIIEPLFSASPFAPSEFVSLSDITHVLVPISSW